MLAELAKMLESCRKSRTTEGLSIVVGPDGAVKLLREALVYPRREVEFTDEPDELFCYDGVPVRLRVAATPGIASLARTRDLPDRSCCDQTSIVSISLAMSWRKA